MFGALKRFFSKPAAPEPSSTPATLPQPVASPIPAPAAPAPPARCRLPPSGRLPPHSSPLPFRPGGWRHRPAAGSDPRRASTESGGAGRVARQRDILPSRQDRFGAIGLGRGQNSFWRIAPGIAARHVLRQCQPGQGAGEFAPAANPGLPGSRPPGPPARAEIGRRAGKRHQYFWPGPRLAAARRRPGEPVRPPAPVSALKPPAPQPGASHFAQPPKPGPLPSLAPKAPAPAPEPHRPPAPVSIPKPAAPQPGASHFTQPPRPGPLPPLAPKAPAPTPPAAEKESWQSPFPPCRNPGRSPCSRPSRNFNCRARPFPCPSADWSRG